MNPSLNAICWEYICMWETLVWLILRITDSYKDWTHTRTRHIKLPFKSLVKLVWSCSLQSVPELGAISPSNCSKILVLHWNENACMSRIPPLYSPFARESFRLKRRGTRADTQTDRQTDRQTDGTDSITSTGDMGGKKHKIIHLVASQTIIFEQLHGTQEKSCLKRLISQLVVSYLFKHFWLQPYSMQFTLRPYKNYQVHNIKKAFMFSKLLQLYF